MAQNKLIQTTSDQRPILYSTPMVKALLIDQKTETRRLTGLEEFNKSPKKWDYLGQDADNKHIIVKKDQTEAFTHLIKCPYGKVGDILYCRETFHPPDEWIELIYKADQPESELNEFDWKPSIFMPKKYARIWLKITDIKLERLQDITENDCIAEGVREVTKDGTVKKYCIYDLGDYSSTEWKYMPYTAKEAFKALWIKINGAHSWKKNPWVWVVKFSRTERPATTNPHNLRPRRVSIATGIEPTSRELVSRIKAKARPSPKKTSPSKK